MPVSKRIIRSEISPYSSKLALNCTTPPVLKSWRYWKAGAPIGIPSNLASLDRDTTQPSLLLSITIGWLCRSGRNRRSQLTKKLSQSISANRLAVICSAVLVNNCRYYTPGLSVGRQLVMLGDEQTAIIPSYDQIG